MAARRVTAEFLPPSGFRLGDARKRIGPILRALARAYPGAKTALDYRSPFELLVATILSAQSTDETVNRVTPALFQRYPDAAALSTASPEDVEALVHPTGFFRQKTKAIIGCAQALVARFHGEVPRRMEDLVQLPGVARKTANVVLANCCPRPQSDHGIFVDTHVRRTSQRLALTGQDEPDHIERELMELVPKRKWAELPHQLVFLGRGPCRARNPLHHECPVFEWCPTGRLALKALRKRR
ncbi:MAG TPA: endonuclease III [Myxococcaceae bacterium]|nr:endonuclease III [Myxococcaceae bacterium]